MRVLYNTREHPVMNDVSVTTGNADGWVLLGHDPVSYRLESNPTTKRPPVAAPKKKKAPGKRKR